MIQIQNRDLDVPELQGTTQEIASAKAKAAAKIINGPVITEDTALLFEAMDGLPGPYIKYFLKSLGHKGLNTLLDGFPTRNATALCTFAFCAGPEAEPMLFEGRAEGRIVEAKGNSTFGWDPIFYSNDLKKTFGESTTEEKNAISHRYRALDKLKQFLTEHPDLL